MKQGDFFVMLTTQNGGFTPLMESTENQTDDPNIASFHSEEEANTAAENSVLGDTFGFEVFERGYGC